VNVIRKSALPPQSAKAATESSSSPMSPTMVFIANANSTIPTIIG